MSTHKYADQLYAEKLYAFTPLGSISPTYPTTHGILFHTTAITLKWAQVPTATTYEIQVATTSDFSGTLIVDATGLTIHQHAFTDTGTNNTKRWWRWRAVGSGTAHDQWSETGSYWVNTSFAETVNCPQNNWMLVNVSPVTDRFTFTDFPVYSVIDNSLWRVRDRNRLGTLLSEFILHKSKIMMEFNQSLYMEFAQYREILRFNEAIKTFFLLSFKDNYENIPTPHCWKVQFESDPELSMVAGGRQDLWVGSLTFEEV